MNLTLFRRKSNKTSYFLENKIYYEDLLAVKTLIEETTISRSLKVLILGFQDWLSAFGMSRKGWRGKLVVGIWNKCRGEL
ncbi:hypothetical protein CHU00_18785 [Sphingobacterium cellulitidis]|nr:hypothetical protein CHU00_18785 [Sphingobacterium cellulitidis]